MKHSTRKTYAGLLLALLLAISNFGCAKPKDSNGSIDFVDYACTPETTSNLKWIVFTTATSF